MFQASGQALLRLVIARGPSVAPATLRNTPSHALFTAAENRVNPSVSPDDGETRLVGFSHGRDGAPDRRFWRGREIGQGRLFKDLRSDMIILVPILMGKPSD